KARRGTRPAGLTSGRRSLLHGEDEVVVVRVRRGHARSRAALVTEVGAHGLQSARGQGIGRGQRLGTGGGGRDRRDEDPGRAVRVGRVVQIQVIGRRRRPGEHGGVDAYGLGGGEGAAVGGLN